MRDNTQSPVQLEATDGGVLLPVRAHPKAKRNAITGVHDGRLKVSVTQAPEKGKANGAILQVLAKSLGLKRSQVELHSGGTSQQKVFLLTDISLAELQRKINAAQL